MNCIFCKIRDKEIPAKILYEDEDIMVFPDVHPVKKVHVLVVPKKHIMDFLALEDDHILSKIRKAIQHMIKEHKLENAGYRLVVNGGGAQVVEHLHFHLTGPWGKAAEL
jgi:histidine triad (HIT) family protein